MDARRLDWGPQGIDDRDLAEDFIDAQTGAATAHTGRGSAGPAERRPSGAAASRRHFFDRFPYGLAVADVDGRILALNGPSAELLAVDPAGVRQSGATCCELICGRVAGAEEMCLTRQALETEGPSTEVRVEIEAEDGAGSRAVWAVASNMEAGRARILFHLRPDASDRRGKDTTLDAPAASVLRIHALGEVSVETASGPIDGEWLQQRPGELLKYLVCERSRSVTSEQIAEALWPNSGQREALTRVRHYVHLLRRTLEPDRSPRSSSRYVATRRGGYGLTGVWVDADEFERRVERGLDALRRQDLERARAELGVARELYRGDFLAEDPFAEWAVAERDRLRELASCALRAVVEIELADGRLAPAAERARELAEMDPFDVDVYRGFLGICLRLGRRSEAVRHYALLRNRMQRVFGEEPGFTLSDLVARPAVNSAAPAIRVEPAREQLVAE